MTDTTAIECADPLDELIELFSGIRRPGDFAALGGRETALPTVVVEGLGTLSFPLPAAQAQALIEHVAERAPYGRGADTLVDEAVRRVWQVPATSLQIRGRAWQQSLDSIIAEAAVGLGAEPSQTTAEFYKLLVYDTGDFFLAHRDSEKAAGMFATLVVVLPSAHLGGELTIRHGDREICFRVGELETSEVAWVAFYADCEHAIAPVRRGYRLALVYNLIHRQPEAETLLPPDDTAVSHCCGELLRRWAGDVEPGAKFAYLLEHRYTQAGLSFAGLKNADAALAKVLRVAAADAGCALHLGMAHIEENGVADYVGGGYRGYRELNPELVESEVIDSERYIADWRDGDDQDPGFGRLPLEDQELLPVDALDDEPADEVHFSEATGNAGASFERTYLRAVLVIWPAAHTDAVCAAGGFTAGLARLRHRLDHPQSDDPGWHSAVHTLLQSLRARLLPEAHNARQRLAQLLPLAVRSGHVATLETLLADALPALYHEALNPSLVASVGVIGAAAMARWLDQVIAQHAESQPFACVRLWLQLGQDGTLARAPHLRLAETLFGAWENRQSTAAAPLHAMLKNRSTEQAGAADGHRLAEADDLARLLACLADAGAAARVAAALPSLLANPARFPVRGLLLPALEVFAAAPRSTVTQGLAASWWTALAEQMLARSEHPPEPPRDWALLVDASSSNAEEQQLLAFARDPLARQQRFALAQAKRDALHGFIRRLGLDMDCETERVGSPHRLLCTKNRASFRRACRRHEADLDAMAQLIDLAQRAYPHDRHLLARLREARGRAPAPG